MQLNFFEQIATYTKPNRKPIQQADPANQVKRDPLLNRLPLHHPTKRKFSKIDPPNKQIVDVELIHTRLGSVLSPNCKLAQVDSQEILVTTVMRSGTRRVSLETLSRDWLASHLVTTLVLSRQDEGVLPPRGDGELV